LNLQQKLMRLRVTSYFELRSERRETTPGRCKRS